jgi:hypothetical protein
VLDGIRLASTFLHAALGAVLAIVVLLVRPAAAQAPSLLYPDLRALPPSVVLLDSRTVDGTTRYALRFTTTIWNAGPGPLELRGESSGDKTLAYQRIYDDAGGVTERLAGEFAYHADHSHWHFESFAEYELWPKAEYDQWVASGRQQGQPRWRGSKTTGLRESFCVRDSEPIETPPGGPRDKFYDACDQELQGISVGWGDSYPFFLAGQWILLGENTLQDGCYVLRVIADPRNLLYESENRDDPDRESREANAGVTVIRVRGPTLETFEQSSEQAPPGAPSP